MGKTNEKFGKLKFVIYTLIIFFIITFVFSFFISFFIADNSRSSGNVAVIRLRGVITVDKVDSFTQTTASSTEIIKLLEEAQEAPGVQAILIDINSPGGSAVASKEIADAIQRINKTTFALIHEIGTSGAYWIASSTDHIIANELSITGSIGVISSYVEFEGLLKRYNMSYQRLIAGKYKDIGDPFKKLEQDERAILQEKLDKIHNHFISVVAKNRNMSFEKAAEIGTGEFYLGIEALENGLIDQLGDTQTAKQTIQQRLNITKVEFSEYARSVGFLDLLKKVLSNNAFLVGKGIGESLTTPKTIRPINLNT